MIDPELAEAETQPAPPPPDWRELVQLAANTLPDRPPFRGCAESLRTVLVDAEDPIAEVESPLAGTLHWLAGALEVLDAYGHVGDLMAIESAYDFVEQALDVLDGAP